MCTKTRGMVDRRKRSKMLNDEKLVEKINKNPQGFLGKVSCKRMPLLHINCKIMYMSLKILPN